MSHSNDLHAVKDIADDAELRLARLIGTVAYTKGVRAVLEIAALRGWKRRAGDDKPRDEAKTLPKGAGSRTSATSQRMTPIKSPRAAREVNVTGETVDLDEARKRRRDR